MNTSLQGSETTGFAEKRWPADFGAGRLIPHFSTFAKQLTALLSTDTRLQLVTRGDSPEYPYSASTVLQVLYSQGRAKELEVRRIIAEAFPEFEIALDYSVPRYLEFKIGRDFAGLPHDPRELQPLLRKSLRLDEQGDGVRSFVGIVTALVVLNRAVYLIDEPEAFLHPLQAYKIGQFIAANANQQRQIFVATHSADVLRGIIDQYPLAQIIRIDRVGTHNRIQMLDPKRLRAIASDPLLSAAGVLDGLFAPRVVVTEADSDSRFYSALSRKLAPKLDIHFVNADNKQTVPKVVAMYRELGVRAVGIVDIDAINNAGEFGKQLDVAGVSGADRVRAMECRALVAAEVEATPVASRIHSATQEVAAIQTLLDAATGADPDKQDEAFRQFRRAIEKVRIDTNAWQQMKKEGSEVLKTSKGAFDELRQICARNGIFINPAGELEASLSGYGIPWQSDKRDWIQRALTLIPQVETDRRKAPWNFISDVHTHLNGNAV